MTKLIAPVLSAVVVSLALSFAFAETKPSQPPQSQVHVLTRVELDGLLAKPAQIIVLDVRRPDEISTIGGFPAYLSIQLSDIEKNLAYVPADRTIVTVSNHAKRAERAAQLLISRGFKVAGAVGVQNYEEQGGKLIKVVKPQTASTAVSAP